MSRWNSRYVAYAKAQGNRPVDQMREDEQRWPGARMASFLLWVQARWAEYRALRREQGSPVDEGVSEADHKAFDEWLEGSLGRRGGR